jgi:ketopantoate reductase
MAHLDVLDDAFGRARVMGGSCQIAATLTRDGVVRSLSEFQNILWGVRDANPRQRTVATALADAFARTQVGWSVSDNVLQDMWEKLAFLCTLAGMTTLPRADEALCRELRRHFGGRGLPATREGAAATGGRFAIDRLDHDGIDAPRY